MLADWSAVKSVLTSRSLSAQYTVIGPNYWIKAIDRAFEIECIVPTDTSLSLDSLDFVTNFQPNANKASMSNIQGIVTTQYELNNKDLKLAKAYAAVDESRKALISMKIPGEFGTGPGRYIEGGYATTEDYDKDDYALVWVSDEDRNIAWMVAKAIDSSATEPVSDATIQGMGVVPGVDLTLPNYPIIKTYYDDDADASNAGWYFWPVAQGNGLGAVGETEVESIAGYAFCPSGLYLNIQYCRATKITGGIRANFLWGKMG